MTPDDYDRALCLLPRDAIRQYRADRDPREPLLAFGRCLAHFAVDPNLVFLATHLEGGPTRFLPFNRGRFGGAGNPPTANGYATAYLWDEVWARDSVRRLVAHAREHGPGRSYLIQHSAGSGKSNSIAWLAHRLSVLHDREDRRVFDSIVVITDRRVLDRQLQRTVRQFERTLGVVENIEKTSRQLREALEAGKTIIVTTLQKFPRIVSEIGELPGKRFAVIVDEAHSSQAGEQTKSLKSVLAAEDLAAAAAEDPRYDRRKADYLLRSFVDLHEHAIRKKVEIMIDHFAEKVAHRIDGRAKAMIVTRSRLHAVRTKLAVDECLKEKRLAYGTLVAFSGTVKDGGQEYTEAGMNGLPEAQTARTFHLPDRRILVVAYKFQTGFDEPLLHTMYVDKKLGGVAAVQTLSRLNRTHPGKQETMVLDFANEAGEIREAFEPYYERTILSEATDPNLLYDLQGDLARFAVFTEAEVEAFANVYFRPGARQDELYALLNPLRVRFEELEEKEREEFRGKLGDYVRLYAFLSQVIPFTDASLEKLYVFARLLARLLPRTREELPREIQRLEERLAGEPALEAAVRANTPENARLTFDHVVNDRLQDMVDTNFKFYKRYTDDAEFAKFLLDLLFERYRKTVAGA